MYLVAHNDFKLELMIYHQFTFFKYTICHVRPLFYGLGHCKCCIRTDLALRKFVKLLECR